MSTTAGAIRRTSFARGSLRLSSDDRLARLVAAGDEHAFATLYGRHHQAIFRYCLSIVRHEQDAQDALQSTMANALASLGRSLPDAPLRPWLFRIAHNEAVSVLRRRRPAAELDEGTLVAARGMETTIEERRRLALLLADLRDLPERQRGALVMRELSGLSHDEIGAALGVPASKAKQAILDARLSLREFDKGRAMRCADVQDVISAQDGRQLRGRPIRAHLRECAGCRELRDGIGARQRDLALLAPPLPPVVAAGLLAKLFGGGSGGSGGVGGSAIVVGKATSATLLGKAIAGAAVVATVGAGVGVSELRAPARDDSPAAGRASSAPGASTAASQPHGAATSRATIAGAKPSSARRRARRGKRRAHEGPPRPAASSSAGDRTSAKTDAPAAARRRRQRARGRAIAKLPGLRVRKRAKPAPPVRRSKPARPSRPAGSAAPAHPAKPAKPVKPKRTPVGQASPEPSAPTRPTATPGARQKDPDLADPGA